VVLAACNTSSADQSDSGEWLSLVPAVHWAGAREVVSSTVFVPDRFYRLESSLIKWLSEEPNTTLSEMLLTLQRDALRRWRGGENAIPPISWAFYMHSGVPTVRAVSRDITPQVEETIWSNSALSLLWSAAELAATLRRRVFHTSMVASAHIGDEVTDADTLVGALVVYPTLGWELLRPDHNPVPLMPGQTPRPSRDVHCLIAAAEAHAHAHHRRLVCTVDVLSAMMLDSRLSGSRLVRRMTSVRHAAVRDRQLREAHAASRWLCSGVVERPNPAVAALFKQLGFTDQWLRRNAAARRRATFDRGFGGYLPIRQRVKPSGPSTASRFPPRIR
jgi:hypothetical protein